MNIIFLMYLKEYYSQHISNRKPNKEVLKAYMCIVNLLKPVIYNGNH
jgi:hypothetical protein